MTERMEVDVAFLPEEKADQTDATLVEADLFSFT